MKKSLFLAAALLCAAFGASAQSAPYSTSPAPSAPNASAPTASRPADPAKFAERKKGLLDARAKGTACLQAATDAPTLMSCMKTEHETIKAMHARHEGMGRPVPASPVQR